MEKVYKVNEFRCYTPGVANFNPQQGHIVRKDSPDGHAGVCARARMYVYVYVCIMYVLLTYARARTHTASSKPYRVVIILTRLLARRYTVRFPAGPEYFSSRTHPERLWGNQPSSHSMCTQESHAEDKRPR
jgi:hypothetical protein